MGGSHSGTVGTAKVRRLGSVHGYEGRAQCLGREPETILNVKLKWVEELLSGEGLLDGMAGHGHGAPCANHSPNHGENPRILDYQQKCCKYISKFCT